MSQYPLDRFIKDLEKDELYLRGYHAGIEIGVLRAERAADARITAVGKELDLAQQGLKADNEEIRGLQNQISQLAQAKNIAESSLNQARWERDKARETVADLKEEREKILQCWEHHEK